MPDWSRRSFLIRTAGVGVAAAVGGLAGRALLDRQSVVPSEAGSGLPPPTETAPPLAAGTDLSPTIPDLTPIVMPNDRFYRIDTSLLTPVVDTAGWTLRIHGMVDRETVLTWDELIGLPMFEQYVTISCVSNEVGGRLVGNAKWTGVRLRDVLEMAGVQAGATQLVGRSVDGWTAGMPTGLGDGSVARADDRAEDERRAAAAGARLSGPPDRARPVRLRLGDEVAQGARADHARGVRRLLGAARLGQGGPDPDPVADRHAARRRGGGRPGPDRRDRLGARSRASPGSRSASTGSGARRASPPRSRTPPGSSGSSTGRRPRDATPSRSEPPTAPARSRRRRARRRRRTGPAAGIPSRSTSA